MKHSLTLENPINSIFITIDGNTVNVINHKYSYTISIQDKSKEEIVNHFIIFLHEFYVQIQ